MIQCVSSKLLIVSAGAAVGMCAGLACAEALVSSGFICDPLPTPQCHASTIAETPEGMVAAWFGGTHERHQDVGIWLARRENGAWLPAREVANGVQPDGTRHPCWNPVLHTAKDGSLTLFFKVGPDCTWWWGEKMVSRDHGRTWSKPERLPNGMIGPIKNKPLALPDGRVLCGASTEFGPWLVHVETFDSAGTWSRTGHLHGRHINAIQPSFLTHPNNLLQMVGRTRERRVFSIFSKDMGRTWGEMTLLEVPNPNAGTDAVTLKDGRHLLVCNPVEKGRTPLVMMLSEDGLRWREVLVLENAPSAEFSYPAVIQAADGRVHVTYTWKRRNVKHAVIDVSQLK